MSEEVSTSCKYADQQRLLYAVPLARDQWYETDCARDLLHAFFEHGFAEVPGYRRPDPSFVRDLNGLQLAGLIVGLDKAFAAPPGSPDREDALVAMFLLISALRDPLPVGPNTLGLTKAQAEACAVESLRPWVDGYATADTPAPIVTVFQCAKRGLRRDLSNAEVRLTWDSLQSVIAHSRCGMPTPGECLVGMGRLLPQS
ncbi:MAG TPA: hypothetical protein VJX92_19020 [Methylomirabilota bacterium]|nr:hypothetical protein [Methylomirabilota bacterium]